MTTVKHLVRTPIINLNPSVFYFKCTRGEALHNRNSLAPFNGDLGDYMKAHQGIPLDCGSEFRDPTGIAKLFIHYEDKEKIIDIIQKVAPYHLLPIEEITRRSDLDAMILRGNHKSAKSNLNCEG